MVEGLNEASSQRCPTCERPARQAFRPFCSKRCADVDLYRWLSGAYVIPVVQEDNTDEFDDDPESLKH